MRDNTIHVIYIAGNGHSGSTLLDIILGSNEGCFSAGELTFITRDSIMKEYCSCNELIPDCEVWSEVFRRWQSNCKISYEDYQRLRLRFERNKTTFRTLLNRFWPSKEFIKYCQATLELFRAIQTVSGCSVIIDSSKSPQRIAVLSRIVDLQVIHLCRDFAGVLNSAKANLTKDIKGGVEADNPPSRTLKVVLDWIFTNFATELFCMGVNSSKVFYKDYVNNLNSLKSIHPLMNGLNKEKEFSTSHMLAGNLLRLEKGLKVNPELGFHYKRLSEKQLSFAKGLDRLFAFWN